MKIDIDGKIISLIVVLVIVGGTVIYFQTGNSAARAGDNVGVDYVGTLDSGEVFDTSKQLVAQESGVFDQRRTYEPLEFTVGAGQMIKGFDEGVVGMKKGETKSIRLAPQDAYGDVRQDLIITVNASQIETDGTQLKVGTPIILENGARGVVIKIEDGISTVDFNHPLAGQYLNFEITLIEIMN